MERFWGYLKRKLASKGGITRARLPLYIAAYVCRYNHRTDPERVKIQRITYTYEYNRDESNSLSLKLHLEATNTGDFDAKNVEAVIDASMMEIQ